MQHYDLFAFIAFACDLYASSRYVLSVRAGRTRPHIFSWIISTLTAGIAAAVSFHEGAALTGFLLTVASIINITTVLVGFRQGTPYISRSDCWAFFGALAAIPLWALTQEPLLAVVCVSTINVLGEIPTIRKAWQLPFEENGEMFFLFAIISIGRLLATQPLTWTTAFYSGIGVCLQLTVFFVVVGRRHVMRPAPRIWIPPHFHTAMPSIGHGRR